MLSASWLPRLAKYTSRLDGLFTQFANPLCAPQRKAILGAAGRRVRPSLAMAAAVVTQLTTINYSTHDKFVFWTERKATFTRDGNECQALSGYHCSVKHVGEVLAAHAVDRHRSQLRTFKLHSTKRSSHSPIKWRLLAGLEAVCATTANAMLLHVLKAKLVKVPNSLRLRGLSRWPRNFDWIAQYCPCRVHAIRSIPSSRGGRSSRLRTAGGTSRRVQTCRSSV
jgi:hypothetical protein